MDLTDKPWGVCEPLFRARVHSRWQRAAVDRDAERVERGALDSARGRAAGESAASLAAVSDAASRCGNDPAASIGSCNA